MRGAELNRNFEVVAHPHAEPGQAVLVRQLLQQSKMRRSRLMRRRDAHQTAHRQLQLIPAMDDEMRCIGGHNAGLLRLFAGVDLNQKRQYAPAPGELRLQGFRQPGAIERLDHVEQAHRLAHLVGL